MARSYSTGTCLKDGQLANIQMVLPYGSTCFDASHGLFKVIIIYYYRHCCYCWFRMFRFEPHGTHGPLVPPVRGLRVSHAT